MKCFRNIIGQCARYSIILLFSLAFLCVVVTQVDALSIPSDTNTCTQDGTTLTNWTIANISTDQSTLQVQCQSNNPQLETILVKSPEALKSFEKGDRVNLGYSETDGVKELKNLSVVTLTVKPEWRIGALFGTAIVLFGATRFILQKRWDNLINGADNRYSNSKFQMALWSSVVVIIYIAFTFLRSQNGGGEFVGGINIPQNLLLLSGLSILTFTGARIITQNQINTNQIIKTTAENPEPSDLVSDDRGRLDLGDFQMVSVTLLAVGVYLVQAFNFMEKIELHQSVMLPDVDPMILAIFGLGQGGYIGKKAVVGDAGGGRSVLKLTTPPMQEDDVLELQKALNTQGASLTPNSVFGEETEKAVKAFQLANNLTVDGIVGPETRKKLGLS